MNFVSSANAYMKSIEDDYSIELSDSVLSRDYGLIECNDIEGFINIIYFAKHDPND